MADIYVKRDEVIEEIKSSFDADSAVTAVMALETKTPEDFMEIKESHKEEKKKLELYLDIDGKYRRVATFDSDTAAELFRSYMKNLQY